MKITTLQVGNTLILTVTSWTESHSHVWDVQWIGKKSFESHHTCGDKKNHELRRLRFCKNKVNIRRC